jgi:DNA-binding response OmpR family regulator
VEYALCRAGFEVRTLETGAGAPDAIAEFQPDLIILDIMLPGMSGFEIAEAVREIDTETAIIMISALDKDSDKIAGLALGADDYVSKPFSTDELLARVQANLRRVRKKDAPKRDAIAVGDLVIDPQKHRVTVAGTKLDLRPKEFELLFALAQNQGTLSTREFLAKEVWDYEHLASSRTIDVHIRRLRAMIEKPSDYLYIQTVHGQGYRFIATKKEE